MNRAVNKTIKNLENNGFKVKYFTSREEVIKSLMDDISTQESVGFASSRTIEELKIFSHIVRRQYKVYYPNKADNPSTRKSLFAKAAISDAYICGTNGITEDGKLVNVDAVGNRLSSMLYGHKRVFVMAGVNKISKTYNKAMERIKNVDCSATKKNCNAVLIMEQCPKDQELIVYLIEENLGS